MNSGTYLFAELMSALPMREFDRCVRHYRGNYRCRTFSCRDQFLCMAFAQLTYRHSLRDIEICLNSMKPKLYHMGIRGTVARNTLAKANQSRDWRIYAEFAQVLIAQARALYAHDEFAVNIDQTTYAFDSTTVDLSLTLFPWASFRRRKAAVKLHTLLDLRGNIPCFVHISCGKVNDVTVLDHLPIEAGAFYIMDRGYIDFTRLSRFHASMAYFVTRAKKNMRFRCQLSRGVDKATGLRCDQTITLTAAESPHKLRRVTYVDQETGKRLVFLTNNFALEALTITRLYRSRWQVELFFKWIKQHLRITSFYGTSDNAVKTQVCTAMSVYMLVAILRKELKLDRTMNEILQILSLSLFEKTTLFSALSRDFEPNSTGPRHNQLSLFEL